MIDQSKKQPDNRIHLFDPVGLINSSYKSPARHVPRSHDAFTGGASPLRFAVEAESADGGGDSDASSPRLWKSPPATSPSPDSRTQAIARGRREMMEMIKDMPESTYELSLRDIVDQKSPSPPPPPQQPDDKSNSKLKSEQRKAAISRSGSKKKVVARSRSIDNGGFLLKTSVFPISFWLKKKSKKNLGSTSSKRKSGVSSESEVGEISRRNGSSSSSSSSSSTISRHGQSNRFLPDCFSFKAKK